jgi:nucleotide-binding universal stress UspA family protein
VNVCAAVLEAASPATALVEYARRNRIDLVVMATHGRTGITHLLLGSTAEKLVRTAPVPVLTVRPTP